MTLMGLDSNASLLEGSNMISLLDTLMQASKLSMCSLMCSVSSLV